MLKSEAKEVLLKTSLIWPKQAVDELTQMEWVECLSRVTFPAALQAVREYRDEGREEAPSVGMIFQRALACEERDREEQRRQRRQLEAKAEPIDMATFRAFHQELRQKSEQAIQRERERRRQALRELREREEKARAKIRTQAMELAGIDYSIPESERRESTE